MLNSCLFLPIRGGDASGSLSERTLLLGGNSSEPLLLPLPLLTGELSESISSLIIHRADDETLSVLERFAKVEDKSTAPALSVFFCNLSTVFNLPDGSAAATSSSSNGSSFTDLYIPELLASVFLISEAVKQIRYLQKKN